MVVNCTSVVYSYSLVILRVTDCKQRLKLSQNYWLSQQTEKEIVNSERTLLQVKLIIQRMCVSIMKFLERSKIVHVSRLPATRCIKLASRVVNLDFIIWKIVFLKGEVSANGLIYFWVGNETNSTCLRVGVEMISADIRAIVAKIKLPNIPHSMVIFWTQ